MSDTGTVSTILQALHSGSLVLFCNVVKGLMAPEFIRSLMFHWYGNYTLQLIITAAGKLRAAAMTDQVSELSSLAFTCCLWMLHFFTINSA